MSPFSRSSALPDAALSPFLSLIAARTGLHVRDKDRAEVGRTLGERMRELGIERPASYLQRLQSDEAEWKRLLPRLTNGESYFWRDKGQFALLRERLLPELIAARAATRTLRLWSAGCSTGEEPYSLAILVDELLPRREEWQVSILGTDINEESLAKARRAVYGSWAFRGLDSAFQNRYFERASDGFTPKAPLRALTRFAWCNLRGSDYPSRAGGLCDMDLILCRNVLIYFERDAIAHALRSFASTLREGGYLLTGHAELAGCDPAPLAARSFAQSVAYQRLAATGSAAPKPENQAGLMPASAPASPSVSAASIAVQREPGARPALAAPRRAALGAPSQEDQENLATPRAAIPAPRAPKAQATVQAATEATAQAASVALRPDAVARARRAADLGRYDEAARHCRDAIARDATDADAYLLWAHVEAERGQRDAAKDLLRKVVYLAPTRYEAHLELAALYDAQRDAHRARRERGAALEILRALPPDARLSAHSGETVAQLVAHLEALVGLVQQPL